MSSSMITPTKDSEPMEQSLSPKQQTVSLSVGLVTALAKRVDSLLAAMDSSRMSSGLPGIFSFVLTAPLRVCKSLLSRLEKLLGLKERTYLTAGRRSKKKAEKMNSSPSQALFDVSGSPASGPVAGRTPEKRKFENVEAESADEDLDVEGELFEDDDDDEGTDTEVQSPLSANQSGFIGDKLRGADLLNISENYKSDEDPDFQPHSEDEEVEEDYTEGDITAEAVALVDDIEDNDAQYKIPSVEMREEGGFGDHHVGTNLNNGSVLTPNENLHNQETMNVDVEIPSEVKSPLRSDMEVENNESCENVEPNPQC